MCADARLIGQTSYIYEAGCGVDDRRRAHLPDRRLDPRRGRQRRPRRSIDAGIPELLFERFPAGSSTTRPGTSGASSRILSAARSTSPRRTRCSPSAATTTCASSTTARSAARWRGSRARPTPTTSSRAGPARRRRSPSTCAPAATRPRSASRSATRSRTSRSRAVGRPLLRRRQRPRARPGAARGDCAASRTSTVTEGAMGDGFYEAVVSTLAERVGRSVAARRRRRARGRGAGARR